MEGANLVKLLVTSRSGLYQLCNILMYIVHIGIANLPGEKLFVIGSFLLRLRVRANIVPVRSSDCG